MDFFSAGALSELFEVVAINVVLSGDNAVVIGLAAAGLPPEGRNRAILIGVVAATALRLVFSVVAAELLLVPGVVLVGGVLLLWVASHMWRELRAPPQDGGPAAAPPARKTLRQAATQIVVADVSMSLDNVLAVTGAARDNPAVLVIGLTLSIVLMAFAASLIARLLNRHRWIAYAGLAIIVYVAGSMIVDGVRQLLPLLRG